MGNKLPGCRLMSGMGGMSRTGRRGGRARAEIAVVRVLEKRLGALPVVAEFGRRLQIAEIVDGLCPVRPVAWITYPGNPRTLVPHPQLPHLRRRPRDHCPRRHPHRHPGKTLATPHSQPPELNHQLTDTRDEWTHQVGCVLFAPVDAIERRRLPAFHIPGQLGTTDLARLGSTRSRTLSQAWTASP
jgi:hypothetical protein